jgi:hypothetical protein
MHRVGFCTLIAVGSLVLNFASSHSARAEGKEWATIKGQIVWTGDVPKQTPVNITADKAVCAMTTAPMEEDFLINPKNKGVKDVFIWIRPTGAAKDVPFPKADINPALMAIRKDPLLIDQPCCKFEPHLLAAREGETLIINGSPKIAHNAKWESDSNGNINPLIPAGGKFALPKPLVAEPRDIQLACSIHPWMKCIVRVFDHPYYAITDEDGKFEIKLAPTGDYTVFVHHPANGWLNGKAGRNGKPYKITAKGLDLGELGMPKNP